MDCESSRLLLHAMSGKYDYSHLWETMAQKHEQCSERLFADVSVQACQVEQHCAGFCQACDVLAATGLALDQLKQLTCRHTD